MPDEPAPGGAGRRFLIATAVTRYLKAPGWDCPDLAEAQERVIDLFTSHFGYTHVSDLGLDPTKEQLTQRLRAFCRSPERRPDDLLTVYIAGHGEVLDESRRHVLLTSDTDPADPDDALRTVELAHKMLDGTGIRRLLLLLDTCYSGQGGNELAADALQGATRQWQSDPNTALVVVSSAQPGEQAQAGAFPHLLAEAVTRLSKAYGPHVLALDAVVDAMNTHPDRPGFQRITLTQVGLTGLVPAFLPNPRRLPRVNDVDPVRDLEVHPAIDSRTAGHEGLDSLPPYVMRRHDPTLRAEVERAPQGSRLVVLTGDSSVGKTRALWEAVRKLPDGWRLWRPADLHTLLDGLTSTVPLAHTVLWLNETQRYLDSTPSDGGERAAAELITLLQDPARGPVLIVGTLWRESHSRLTVQPDPTDPDPHAQARALLHAGSVIPVADRFSDDDLTDLRALADRDPRLAEAVQDGGARITQYLAGGRELLHRYETAPAEAAALLHAAADARRLGHGEALPEKFLRAAGGAYLDPDHWRCQTDQWRAQWFTLATAYTRQPCRGVPGPLTPDIPLPGEPVPDQVTYRLADYLQQHTARTRRRTPPPVGLWNAAAEHLTHAADLIALAVAALDRGLLRQAAALYRRAADAGHTNALVELATLRTQAGDSEGAQGLYSEAGDAGNIEALRVLALRREQAGDYPGAEDLARKAMAAGSTVSLWTLAKMREQAGKSKDAERLARECLAAADTRPLMELATLRESPGDVVSAERLYREAADAGDTSALLNLVWLRVLAGDSEGADCLLRQAADAQDTRAMRVLAAGRERVGDGDGAERLIWKAMAAGDTGAVWVLVRLREWRGDHEGAERLAQEAAVAGHPRVLRELAEQREAAGDSEGTESLYRQAAEAGDISSIRILANRLERAGDHAGAERLAHRAAAAGDTGALLDLAQRRWITGDSVAVERLCQRAADAGSIRAMRILTKHLEDAGDHAGAERLAHETAIAGDPKALQDLAVQRWHAGDSQSAERLARAAAAAGSPGVLVHLGRLYEAAGNSKDAERLYRHAADTGDWNTLMELARAQEATGDLVGAERYVREALTAGYPIALRELIRLREKAGHRQDAEQIQRFGLNIDGSTAEPW